MAYTAWSVAALDVPSTAKWNILGTNDAWFESLFTIQRQGGGANDFTTPGTTTFAETEPLIQMGSIATVAGTNAVTFPVAFSQKPIVILTNRGTGGTYSGGWYLVTETASGFNIQVNATNPPPSFNWVAYGRR